VEFGRSGKPDDTTNSTEASLPLKMQHYLTARLLFFKRAAPLKARAATYEPKIKRPAIAWALSVSIVGNIENHVPIHDGIELPSHGISVVGHQRASCIS